MRQVLKGSGPALAFFIEVAISTNLSSNFFSCKGIKPIWNKKNCLGF